jgi:hypothetical protein
MGNSNSNFGGFTNWGEYGVIILLALSWVLALVAAILEYNQDENVEQEIGFFSWGFCKNICYILSILCLTVLVFMVSYKLQNTTTATTATTATTTAAKTPTAT